MRRTLLCALWLLSACGDDERGAAVPADTLNPSYVSERTAAALAPVRAASEVEATLVEQAIPRITREPVQQYAQVVVADHRAVVGVLDSVARARALSYLASAAARDVESAVRTIHTSLQAVAPEEFDLAFVRAEVETHRQLVDRLDRELIPAARADDLKQLLLDVRAMSDAHLTRARQLLTELLGVMPAQTRPATTRPRPDTTAQRVRPDTTTRLRTDTLSVGGSTGAE